MGVSPWIGRVRRPTAAKRRQDVAMGVSPWIGGGAKTRRHCRYAAFGNEKREAKPDSFASLSKQFSRP